VSREREHLLTVISSSRTQSTKKESTMQETFYSKTQTHLSHKFFLSYPIAEMNTSLSNTTIFAPKLSFIRSSLFLLHRTQIQNPIICARKAQQPVICARKRRRRNGSQRLTRYALELISIMASKINILPQPLDLVIGEIGCGDGNGAGVWLWKVFGGGGFDGWRRKGKIKMLLLGFLLIFGLGLLFGKELERNVLCGCLGIGLLDVVLIQWWGKRRSKDWVLGFCVGGVLMGFGLRREQMQKWVERVRVCPPMMEVGRRRRRGKVGRSL
jgi:hypothetical protein